MASNSPLDPSRNGAEDDVRRRFACDRCHTQKTRCPRKPGQSVCDRCNKAKAECLFSPFRQKKGSEEENARDDRKNVNVSGIDGPTKNTDLDHVTSRKRARPSPDANMGIELRSSFDFTIPTPKDTLGFGSSDSGTFSQDWVPTDFSDNLDPSLIAATDLEFGSQASATPYFFGDFPSTSKQYQSLLTNGPSQMEADLNAYLETESSTPLQTDSTSPDSTTDIPRPPVYYSPFTSQVMDTDPLSICVRKLSQLSVELFDHKLTIPPLSIHDPNSIQYRPDPTPVDYSNYSVEDIFRLTQTLVDIYPSFLSTAIRHEEPKGLSHSSTCSNQPITQLGPRELSGSPLRGAQTIDLDHSSILLMISCHLRLIEVYELLFQHLGICIQHKGVPVTAEQASLTAPQLKIGSYTPPQSAAVSMQMLMLVQFATQLSDYASDLTTEIDKPRVSGSGSEVLASTKAAAQSVKLRARNMSQDLSFLRGQLLSNGVMA